MLAEVRALRAAHRRNARVQIRATAVLLTAQGATVAEVADTTGLTRVTILRLTQAVRSKGAAAALIRPTPQGRPSRAAEVLQLASSGQSTAEISAALKVHPETVRGHLRRAQAAKKSEPRLVLNKSGSRAPRPKAGAEKEEIRARIIQQDTPAGRNSKQDLLEEPAVPQ